MSMSTSMSMSGSSTIASSAGAHVPITRTWVQGSETTAIALVGQILDDGNTNYVGYGEGSAFYILPSSASGAEQTTLAGGDAVYVVESKAPTGYLATTGSDGSMMTASETGMDMATSSSDGGMASETAATSSSGSDSQSSTQSAASTSTSPGAAQQLSAGGVFTVLMGLLAVFGL